MLIFYPEILLYLLIVSSRVLVESHKYNGNLDVGEEGARRELQRFPLEGSDVETEIWWKKSEPGGGGEEEFSR